MLMRARHRAESDWCTALLLAAGSLFCTTCASRAGTPPVVRAAALTDERAAAAHADERATSSREEDEEREAHYPLERLALHREATRSCANDGECDCRGRSGGTGFIPEQVSNRNVYSPWLDTLVCACVAGQCVGFTR